MPARVLRVSLADELLTHALRYALLIGMIPGRPGDVLDLPNVIEASVPDLAWCPGSHQLAFRDHLHLAADVDGRLVSVSGSLQVQ